jgi:hypothetical protein
MSALAGVSDADAYQQPNWTPTHSGWRGASRRLQEVPERPVPIEPTKRP